MNSYEYRHYFSLFVCPRIPSSCLKIRWLSFINCSYNKLRISVLCLVYFTQFSLFTKRRNILSITKHASLMHCFNVALGYLCFSYFALSKKNLKGVILFRTDATEKYQSTTNLLIIFRSHGTQLNSNYNAFVWSMSLSFTTTLIAVLVYVYKKKKVLWLYKCTCFILFQSTTEPSKS